MVVIDVRSYIAEIILLSRPYLIENNMTVNRDWFVVGFVDEVLYLRNVRNSPLQEAVLLDRINQACDNKEYLPSSFKQLHADLARRFINYIEASLHMAGLNLDSAYTYRTLVNNATLVLEV